MWLVRYFKGYHIPNYHELLLERFILANRLNFTASTQVISQLSPWLTWIMLANWLLLFIFLSAIQGNVSAFNPLNYAKSAARCVATRREPVLQDVLIDLGTLSWAPSSILTPNRHLEYVEINPDAPNTLLMIHGWPSLWSSWSKQIEEFQVRCTVKKNDMLSFLILSMTII
jgi:hypothetical protein